MKRGHGRTYGSHHYDGSDEGLDVTDPPSDRLDGMVSVHTHPLMLVRLEMRWKGTYEGGSAEIKCTNGTKYSRSDPWRWSPRR